MLSPDFKESVDKFNEAVKAIVEGVEGADIKVGI